MMMSTPFSLCCTACLTLPHSAATSRPEAWMRSMISFGGVPSALAISFTFGRFRASSSSGEAVASVQPSRPSLSLLSGHSGTPCSRSSFAAKSWCSCGHHGLQLLLELRGIDVAHALVFLRDHDVDPVGLVADVRVDPVELLAQLLRREAHGAQHAEAAGLADGDDHVAAMGEGEDREVDAETVTERSAHGCLPLVIAEAPIMAPAATRRQCKCGSTGRVQSDQARLRRPVGGCRSAAAAPTLLPR